MDHRQHFDSLELLCRVRPDSRGIVTSPRGAARVAPPLLKTKVSSRSAPSWPRPRRERGLEIVRRFPVYRERRSCRGDARWTRISMELAGLNVGWEGRAIVGLKFVLASCLGSMGIKLKATRSFIRVICCRSRCSPRFMDARKRGLGFGYPSVCFGAPSCSVICATVNSTSLHGYYEQEFLIK